MTIRNDAAAAARAAAARRAAEEARRRAAEEAARKAAQAAAKKAAEAAARKAAEAAAKKAAQAAATKKLSQTAASKAGERPTLSAVRQAFGRDEMSQGLGRALRQRSAAALGGQAPALQGPPPGGVQAGRLAQPQKPLVNGAAPTLTNKKPAQTAADRELAALAAREGTRDTLKDLGIETGADLARLGEQLHAQAESGEAADDAVTLASVENQVALAEIIQSAGRAAPGTSELLTNEAFANAVAAGSTPKEAATAVAAQELYDETLKPTVQKPLSQWTPGDAVNFTEALADAVEEHSDDPTMVNQLIALSQGRLQRTAEIVGQATEANDYDGDDIETLAGNLSRVGNAAPDDGAAAIAATLAAEIDDDSELNKVDDGFKHFIEDGGSDRFRSVLNAALEAQGKSEAAEELREDGGGSSLGDRWGDVVGAFTDVAARQANWALSGANAVYQAGGDALRGQVGRTLDVVDRGLELVEDHGPASLRGAAGAGRRGVDVARGGLELHDRLQESLGGAVVAGGTGAVRIAGGAVADPAGTARAALDAADQLRQAAALGEQIETLGVGDQVKLSAKVGGAVLGLDGELTGDITVTRLEDGSYRVRADGTVGLGADSTSGAEAGVAGASASAEAHATGGVAFEFNLDSAEDATTAVRTLMGPVGGGLAGLAEGTLDGFRPDPGLLTGNLSAVEVHGGQAAQLAAGAGFEIGAELRAQLDANATLSARIELGGEEPTLVLSGEVKVAAAATATAGAPLAPQGGKADPSRAGLPSANARAGGDVTLKVSQRFTLPESLDAGAFVRDPVDTLRDVASEVVADAQTVISLTAGVEGRAGAGAAGASESVGGGAETRVVVTAPTGELVGVLPELLDGRFSDAHRELLDSSATVEVRTLGRTRSQVGLEAKAGDGADSVEFGFEATRTDYEETSKWNGSIAEAEAQLTGAFADVASALHG